MLIFGKIKLVQNNHFMQFERYSMISLRAGRTAPRLMELLWLLVTSFLNFTTEARTRVFLVTKQLLPPTRKLREPEIFGTFRTLSRNHSKLFLQPPEKPKEKVSEDQGLGPCSSA